MNWNASARMLAELESNKPFEAEQTCGCWHCRNGYSKHKLGLFGSIAHAKAQIDRIVSEKTAAKLEPSVTVTRWEEAPCPCPKPNKIQGEVPGPSTEIVCAYKASCQKTWHVARLSVDTGLPIWAEGQSPKTRAEIARVQTAVVDRRGGREFLWEFGTIVAFFGVVLALLFAPKLLTELGSAVFEVEYDTRPGLSCSAYDDEGVCVGEWFPNGSDIRKASSGSYGSGNGGK